VEQSSASDTRLGERLAYAFMAMLQAKDVPGLRRFLSPAFQIVRSNGTAATKREYLADLPDVRSFSQSDFHVTRSGDTLVVRSTAVVSVVAEGQQSASSPAPRLSVFKRNPATGVWQMVAHSNFVPFA
jgi:ketosteroid isomerase-like protein